MMVIPKIPVAGKDHLRTVADHDGFVYLKFTIVPKLLYHSGKSTLYLSKFRCFHNVFVKKIQPPMEGNLSI